MAYSFLPLALVLLIFVAVESAPSKSLDGSGELPPDERKSLEKEGFFPRRRFGDPPLGPFPVGGFNPRPDGAPWMSESGDPVFPVFEDEHEGPKEESDEDNEIYKPVDNNDRPVEDHPSHEGPIPADHDDDEEDDNDIPDVDHPSHERPIPADHDDDDEEDDKDDEHHEMDADDEEEDHQEDKHKVDFEEPELPEEGDEDGDSKDQDINDSEEAPNFGSFMFDTPFFNVRQVSKYFQHLEKALEQVFHQTLDEATLLNGTYANTTEEEVEINGKKYLVQKSIIQGKDNHSSIYVEAMSASPGSNKTEEAKDSGL